MQNDTIKTMFNRTSLRVYDTQSITKAEEDCIIESALRAPTAGNQMMYSMIIIRDQKKQKTLSKLCDYQMFIEKAPLVIVFVADHHRWYDYFRMNDVEAFTKKQKKHFRQPAESDLMLAIEDAMAAAQNSVIAAESLGIGSVYIGDILENYEEVKAMLALPDETFPIAMLCYGHYKQDHKKVYQERFKREYIVFEDQYQQLSAAQYQDMFQKREERFSPQNKYAAQNFAQQFYAMKTGASFSEEMQRSVKVALQDWTKE